MADPVSAAPLASDLSSLLGIGGSATGSVLLYHFLSQWKAKRNGNGSDYSTRKIEQKVDALVSTQRELTGELRVLTGEFREFIGYMKAKQG